MRVFDKYAYIDPKKMEIAPFSITKKEIDITTRDKKSIKVESGASSIVNKFQIISNIVYNGIFLYMNPAFFLLLRAKKIYDFSSLYSRVGTKGLAVKLFSKSKAIDTIEKAISYSQNGNDELAVEILKNVELELDLVGEDANRLKIVIYIAELEMKRMNFLTAFHYFSRACEISLYDDTDKHEVDGEVINVSLKAKCYMNCAIALRGVLLQSDYDRKEMRDLFANLSLRAKSFFEQEANYRESHGIFFNGNFKIGKLNIPKPSFGADKLSAKFNRQLALGLKNLEVYFCEYEDLNVKQIIKDLRNSDDKFSTIEILGVLSNKKVKESLKDDDIEEIVNFLNCKINNTSMNSEEKIISVMDFLSLHSDDVYILSKVLDVLDSNMNNDSNLFIFEVVEKTRQRLSPSDGRELIEKIKENYSEVMPEQYLKFYQNLQSPDPRNEYSLFNMKLNEGQFDSLVLALDQESYHVAYQNDIWEVSNSEFKSLLLLRQSAYGGFDINKVLSTKMFLDNTRYDISNNKKVWDKTKALELVKEAVDFKELLMNYTNSIDKREISKLLNKRYNEASTKIGVFGVVSSGKSTFLNAILGEELLATHKDICSNVATEIDFCNISFNVEIFFKNSSIRIKKEELSSYISEQENKDNHKGVVRAVIHSDSKIFPKDVCLVDIPGLGTYREEHNFHKLNIESQLNQIDGVIFITTPSTNITNYEREFLEIAIDDKYIPFLTVVNKIDNIEEDQVEDVLFELKRKFIENNLVDFPSYYACSSIQYLKGIIEDSNWLESEGFSSHEEAIKESMFEVGVSKIENLIEISRKNSELSMRKQFLDIVNGFEEDCRYVINVAKSMLIDERQGYIDELNHLKYRFSQIENTQYYTEKMEIIEKRYKQISMERIINAVCSNYNLLSVKILDESKKDVIRSIHKYYLEDKESYVSPLIENVLNNLNKDLSYLNSFYFKEDTVKIFEFPLLKIDEEKYMKRAFLGALMKKQVYECLVSIVEDDVYWTLSEVRKNLEDFKMVYNKLSNRYDLLKCLVEESEDVLKSRICENNEKIRILAELKSKLMDLERENV